MPKRRTARPPLALRLFLSIPLIGGIARDLLYGDKDNIYYFLVIVVTLEVVLVMTFGVVALTMTALAFVPVYFIILILVTRG